MRSGRQNRIIQMFNDIANSYDRANRIISLGADQKWRKNSCVKTYELINKKELDLVVDVACGTGDMTYFWQSISKKKNIKIENIKGIDPARNMISLAKNKYPELDFLVATATKLNLNENSADIISISYGLRNVIELEKALQEFKKTLKENGLLVILEFMREENENFISKAKSLYMKNMLPFLGSLMSKNKRAYKYLPSSIDKFLSQKELEKKLKENGFSLELKKNFMFNASTLFVLKKINA